MQDHRIDHTHRREPVPSPVGRCTLGGTPQHMAERTRPAHDALDALAVKTLAGHPDRERSGALWLRELGNDVQFAFRQLRSHRRFAFVAILTLAIGLGASVVIFGIANAVMLRPLPFAEPSRMLIAFETTPAGQDWAISEPNYLDWRERQRGFAFFAAFSDRTLALTGDGDPEQLRAAAVTHEFFPAVGVAPARGR